MDYLLTLIISFILTYIATNFFKRNILFKLLFLFWALANMFISFLYKSENFLMMAFFFNVVAVLILIVLYILVGVLGIFKSVKEIYEEKFREE